MEIPESQLLYLECQSLQSRREEETLCGPGERAHRCGGAAVPSPALVALLEEASITLGSFGSNQNRSQRLNAVSPGGGERLSWDSQECCGRCRCASLGVLGRTQLRGRAQESADNGRQFLCVFLLDPKLAQASCLSLQTWLFFYLKTSVLKH